MDAVLMRVILAGFAVLAASIAGYFAGWEIQFFARRKKLREKALGSQMDRVRRFAVKGLLSKTLDYLENLSRRLALGSTKPLVPARIPAAWFSSSVGKSGLRESVSIEGFREARVRLGLSGMAGGLVFGALFSNELMVLGGLGGLFLGASLPRIALLQQIDKRAQALERELPELLEVVALGLRSGLSFDRSFALYAHHFSTTFSEECENAQNSWSLGLTTREEALRNLASSYSSASFKRVVETMIRSLRFGSALGGELGQAAQEARLDRRSSREEAAAKAPVKMMIPTGVLILPAMLLMVLGPVLLEMMSGF